MSPVDPSGSRPPPVVLRIKLRYDDVETLLQRFAANVGRAGLFLPTKSLQAVGAEIKFELRLADGRPVLVGLGRVKASVAPDPANPRATFGMAIELTRVTRESRDVILKLLERRKRLGLPELAVPMAEDIDAARRERDSAPVLTSARRPSGPLAVARPHELAPLAPERPRKPRATLEELIEKASGPIAAPAVTVPGLDDDVDVRAVLVRARALAGDHLDAELEALRDSAAAPIEIGVEAASAELARQLGGVAVTRERGGRWAPPPALGTTDAPAALDEEPEIPRTDLVEAPEPTPEPAPEPASIPAPQPAPAFEPTPAFEPDLEPDTGEELAFADAERTVIAGVHEIEGAFAELHAAPGAPAYREADDEPLEEFEEIEEIEEFEIIAEADAEDEDLLVADGEADASAELDRDPADEFADEYAAPGFPPLHPFDSSDVIEVPMPPRPTAPPPAVEGVDLETAIEALDVNLDDLAITHAPTQVPRTSRLASEIPIDLDDFEQE